MKLGCAAEGSITESKSYIRWSLLHEHETAPTWAFDYQRYRNDPSPKILVLGTYAHPVTGNNLVGGINLNYLSPRQKLQLRKQLPNLMTAKNLYDRYHLGLRTLPDIFDTYYRTYNPAFIRGIQQDVIIPDVPKADAGSDLIKHRLDRIKKTKTQRQQEYMPKYPKDISNMEKAIDKKTDEILKQPPAELPLSAAPEVRAAVNNKIDQKAREEHPEMIAVPSLQQEVDQEDDGYIAPEPDKVTRPEVKSEIQDETEETETELEAETDEDPLDMKESLIYYDPTQRRYIIEPAYSFVSHHTPKTR